MTTVITISIEEDLLDRIRKEAVRDRRSLSNVVARAVEKYLNEKERKR